METFLNERSLHSQFHDLAEIAEAITILNRVLLRISELDVEKELFLDRQLYHAYVTNTIIFASCLEHIPDKSARIQFKRLVRDLLNGREWVSERMHAGCSYLWNGEEMNNSSVAELAERTLQRRIGFLLNFSPSKFPSGRSVLVTKDTGELTTLDSVNTEADLDTWCDLVPELGLVRYDPTCGRPPRDSETILRDRGRFQRTSLRNKTRLVYLERSTGYYFCVDNQHEHDAHLEVFNANGDHVGIATLDGSVDKTAAKRGRRLGM